MAKGQGQQRVKGASGNVRNVTSNVAGTKHDHQMDTASSEGAGTVTGSAAADKVIEQKAADTADKDD